MATKRHIADLWATRKIAEHPSALDSANIFYAARKNGELSWPEWCGLPMASTYAILTNGADLTTAKEMLAQMGVEELAALTAALIWVRAKAVYKFDPDLGAPCSPNPSMTISLPKACMCFRNSACLLITLCRLGTAPPPVCSLGWNSTYITAPQNCAYCISCPICP